MSLQPAPRKTIKELNPIYGIHSRGSSVDAATPISMKAGLLDRNPDRKQTLKLIPNNISDSIDSSDLSPKSASKRLPKMSILMRKEDKNLTHDRSLMHQSIAEESTSILDRELLPPVLPQTTKMKSLQDAPVLYLSKEILTNRSGAVKPFNSFKALMTLERQKDQRLDQELKELRTSRNLINKQLILNKMSERVYEVSVQEVERDSYRKIFNAINNRKHREQMMPPIRKYPSRSLSNSMFKGMKSDFHMAPTKTDKSVSSVKVLSENLKAQFEGQVSIFIYKGPELLSNRPEVREGAGMVMVGKYAYLYGGRSKNLINNVDVLDTGRYSWSKADARGEVPSEGRYGHTVCLYRSSLIVFGGEKHYNQAFKMRECLNDVKFYSIDTKEWKTVKCYGENIEPRRNHVAAVVGRSMIVYGGIASNGLYHSDLMALNFSNMRWSQCNVTNCELVGLAFHACCLVVHPDRKDVQLYKGMETPVSGDRNPAIKEEGLYVFGGKNEFGEIVNTLKILKLGQRPLTWLVPETKGKPPAPRCQHVVLHYYGLNALIIHGGRNDRAPNAHSKGGSFDDVAMLNLETLQWISVTTHGLGRSARFSHCAGVIGTKIIIFGGMSFSEYMDSTIEIAELDQNAISLLLQEEKQKMLQKEATLTQIPAVLDSVFPRKSHQQPVSKLTKSTEKVMTFLPIPTKEELKKEQHGESLDDGSPKKIQPQEIFRSAIKKLMVARRNNRVRTLPPLKESMDPVEERKSVDVLKLKLKASTDLLPQSETPNLLRLKQTNTLEF